MLIIGSHFFDGIRAGHKSEKLDFSVFVCGICSYKCCILVNLKYCIRHHLACETVVLLNGKAGLCLVLYNESAFLACKQLYKIESIVKKITFRCNYLLYGIDTNVKVT